MSEGRCGGRRRGGGGGEKGALHVGGGGEGVGAGFPRVCVQAWAAAMVAEDCEGVQSWGDAGRSRVS